jgi:hypothetical protein
MHALHLRHPSTLPPTFPPGGTGRPGGGDSVQIGFVDGAPDIGQIGRHAGQIREIEATALALPARVRTDLGVKAHRPEQCSANTARSRLRYGPSSSRHHPLLTLSQ